MIDATMFLVPERTCLMVIDPQKRLMAAIHQADRMVKNTALMIHCAQVMEIPVIGTTQYVQGLGPWVDELARLVPERQLTDKTEFNALANETVNGRLWELPAHIDTFLVTGAESHICVMQTVMGLIEHGKRPWVVADAVSSRNPEHVQLALQRMRHMGVTVGPAESAVYELLHRAGTERFKALLPYLK